MQGGENEVQQSVRRLIGLFGQVLVELGNLMGAHAQAALPAGTSVARSAPEPPGTSAARSAPDSAGTSVAVSAREAQAAAPGAGGEDAREQIERAVDAGLAMLAGEERGARHPGGGGGRADEESGFGWPGSAVPGRPTEPPPETRILRPAWMRASAPPFSGNDVDGPAELQCPSTDEPPQGAPAPRGAQPPEGAAPASAPGENPGPAKDPWAQPPATFQAGDLFLVCAGQEGRHLAIPWNWVVDTHLSSRGTPEAFTLSDGGQERQVTVSTVVGIWTKAELEQWQEKVRWLASLETLQRAPSADPGGDPAASAAAPHATAPAAPAAAAATDDSLPAGAAGPAAAVPRTAAGPAGVESGGAQGAVIPREVWVVSPSALARRFLLRHLEHSGLEIREARDLDDPLLPADLGNVGAVFLDESLQEQWRDHPTGRFGGPPLVLLTVDGVLHVPSSGERCATGAVLPRPFERSEVESVIGWLRSLWRQDRAAGDEDHGDEEDDTWLFADPFGSPGP